MKKIQNKIRLLLELHSFYGQCLMLRVMTTFLRFIPFQAIILRISNATTVKQINENNKKREREKT